MRHSLRILDDDVAAIVEMLILYTPTRKPLLVVFLTSPACAVYTLTWPYSHCVIVMVVRKCASQTLTSLARHPIACLWCVCVVDVAYCVGAFLTASLRFLSASQNGICGMVYSCLQVPLYTEIVSVCMCVCVSVWCIIIIGLCAWVWVGDPRKVDSD